MPDYRGDGDYCPRCGARHLRGRHTTTMAARTAGWQKELAAVEQKGVISPELRDAIHETQAALKAKDYDRAADLTGVKSFICGAMEHCPVGHLPNETPEQRAEYQKRRQDDQHVLDIITSGQPNRDMSMEDILTRVRSLDRFSTTPMTEEEVRNAVFGLDISHRVKRVTGPDGQPRWHLGESEKELEEKRSREFYPHCRFREDSDRNKQVLGDSVYGILDGMNHEISGAVGAIPAGMMVLTSRGARQHHVREGTRSPTLRYMRQEHNSLVAESKADNAESDAAWKATRPQEAG